MLSADLQWRLMDHMLKRGGHLHRQVLARYYHQGLAALSTDIQSEVVRTTGGGKVRLSKDHLRMWKEIGTGMDPLRDRCTADKVRIQRVGDGRGVRREGQLTITGGVEELHPLVSMGLPRGLVTIPTRAQGSCMDLGLDPGREVLVAGHQVQAGTVTTAICMVTRGRCCDQQVRCTQ